MAIATVEWRRKSGEPGAMLDVFVADSFGTRFRGLMGRKEHAGRILHGRGTIDAMWLRNTRQVHTHFMRFPQQTCYLDENGFVLMVHTLSPWRFGPYVRTADSVLELPAASPISLVQGDRIVMLESR